ncbi:hypothetical protein BV20DRAFT_962814 [Pilatotrama ljubarskyi]|nr:hypothetical protein BV20DRAFT_962797 [Pilatotrama ljubarskyi]KAI0373604.1 hypothetical protein BV20DRAFT_962814 [Pilatotrama ljubarskyi]
MAAMKSPRIRTVAIYLQFNLIDYFFTDPLPPLDDAPSDAEARLNWGLLSNLEGIVIHVPDIPPDSACKWRNTLLACFPRLHNSGLLWVVVPP